MTNVVIAGSGGQRDEFVELAARPGVTPKGKLYRKQILHWGDFQHPNLPGQKITVDQAFADKLVTNFSNGVCDIVQVPVVDDKNRHSEDPFRNLGEVVDIDTDDKGIYAVIDARKPEYAKELGSTLIGASAMLNLDYTDTRTGTKVGPTLLHCAVTNRPYITNLAPFSEVVAMSADTSDEATVLIGTETTEEPEMPMTKDEMIAALAADHGIDVNDLLQRVQNSVTAEEMASLSNVLGEEFSGSDVADAVLELSAENSTLKDNLAELSASVTELVGERDALRLSKAEDEIDGYVKAGRILPKARARMLKLSMEDRETFEDLLPDEAIVSLSESGVTTHESTHAKDPAAEIDRYVETATKTN